MAFGARRHSYCPRSAASHTLRLSCGSRDVGCGRVRLTLSSPPPVYTEGGAPSALTGIEPTTMRDAVGPRTTLMRAWRRPRRLLQPSTLFLQPWPARHRARDKKKAPD